MAKLQFWSSITLVQDLSFIILLLRYLWACCWTLAENEHMTMNHQLLWDLIIRSWALSNSPSYKIGCEQQQSIIYWKPDWAWANPECILWISHPVAYDFYVFKTPSVSKHAPTAWWGVSCDMLLRKSSLGLGLLMVLYNMQTSSRNGHLQYYYALPGQPYRTLVKENSQCEHNFGHCTH